MSSKLMIGSLIYIYAVKPCLSDFHGLMKIKTISLLWKNLNKYKNAVHWWIEKKLYHVAPSQHLREPCKQIPSKLYLTTQGIAKDCHVS